MRFLTRTFRIVLCSGALENSLLACCVRNARGETEVGTWKTPAAASEPRPLPPLAPLTLPAGTKPNGRLEPANSEGIILPETGQFLLLCSLQLWLQRCRQTRARVPLFLIHFASVLRKQFAANEIFLARVKKLAAVADPAISCVSVIAFLPVYYSYMLWYFDNILWLYRLYWRLCFGYYDKEWQINFLLK